MQVFRALLLLGLVTSPLAGCVTDLTGTSSSHLLQTRIDTLRERARALDQDLGRERARVDLMETRALEARRRYADAGASVQALMEDFSYIRGEIAQIRDNLRKSGSLAEDTDFRITALEAQLAHVEGALEKSLPDYELAPMMAPPVREEPGEDFGGSTDKPEESAVVPDPAGSGGAGAGSTGVVPATPEASPEVGAKDEVPEEPEMPEKAADSELYEDAKHYFADQSWRQAGKRFIKLLKEHPESVHAGEARFLLAMCLYELKRHEDAIGQFQKVIDRNSKSELAAQAMYMQGESWMAMGTKDGQEAAEVFFSDVIKNYPDSPHAEKARKKLGELRGR
ncbi:MAG: outer membrane protein assembly factor BamD [Myxococcota bacterium]|nr:outer membrane protein assembly factor BamD [Myxococcota bacterium]